MGTTDAHQDHQPKDLTPLLTDLENRANRVMTSLYLLWQLDNEFSAIEKGLEQQYYINIIRSHTKKMEADLDVMRRKNELLDDDRISDWTNKGRDDTAKANRQVCVIKLTKKIEDLQEQMAEAKRGYVEQRVRQRKREHPDAPYVLKATKGSF
jgi:hypothetical protein